MNVQTIQPLIIIYLQKEKYCVGIIIGNVHQFIACCVITLDPWLPFYFEGTPDSQDGMENSNDAGYDTTADGDDTTNDEPAAAPIARCGVCEIPLKKPTSHYGGNG